MLHYLVTVMFLLGQKEVTVQAENANDAVIAALLRLELRSLETVVGISIS